MFALSWPFFKNSGDDYAGMIREELFTCEVLTSRNHMYVVRELCLLIVWTWVGQLALTRHFFRQKPVRPWPYKPYLWGRPCQYNTERGAYQAAHCWGKMMVAAPEPPSKSNWGGRRKTQADGKFTGAHYQKWPSHVVNSSSVGARGGSVKEGSNEPRPTLSWHFSIHPSVEFAVHCIVKCIISSLHGVTNTDLESCETRC